MVAYTSQQSTAIELAVDSLLRGDSLYRIGGYAGTGKTTCMKRVFELLPGGAIVAFAGKACDVLQRKGLPGQTIHSLIYKFDPDTQKFYLVENLDHVEWIGVDEGSMVGEALWSDLCHFKRPMLVIGDPGQLEPVADNDPHLMREPDYLLEEIHRQALDNPIIKLSLKIRQGELHDWGKFGKHISQLDKDLLWADMIICGYNKTRLAVNSSVRKAKKFKDLLSEGERIICKNNDRELGVFNGQMFTVDSKNDDGYQLTADGGRRYTLPIAREGFNSYQRPSWSVVRKHVGRRMIADYGYAITCHGSQGSEWDKVAYIDEQCHMWCPTRHRYTGVTRAAEELVVYHH